MSEVTFKPYQLVLVRDSKNQVWSATFFSHEQHSEDSLIYVCSGLPWNYCIPYEGNEHLVGTTNSPTPPEPEFRFGDKVEVRDGDSQEWRKAIFLKMHMPYYFCLLDSEATACWKRCRHADW